MAWKSGTARYVVREAPEVIVAGIQALAERKGLRVIASKRPSGVRLTTAAVDREGAGIPALDVGEVELRFTRRDGLVRVEVRSRRRRRWWALSLVGALGLGTVFVDLIASMGTLTRELHRAFRRSNDHHLEADPLLLHAVSSYLGPRGLGTLDEAPFRRR